MRSYEELFWSIEWPAAEKTTIVELPSFASRSTIVVVPVMRRTDQASFMVPARTSDGVTPKLRRKLRLKWDRSMKPTSNAIVLI